MAKTQDGLTLASVNREPSDLRKRQLAGWLETGLIFAAGLLLFLAGLGNRELVQLECRTGLFVKEMLENGISWFPTVYGRPYPDYPVTHSALIYALSILFDQFSIQVAVLPTALAGAMSLALTYRIGLIVSRPLAVWAVLFELGTYGFFATARSVSLDHLTTAITAGCFLAAYGWLIRGRSRHFALILLLCIAGFACRGPIGFVLPAAVAVTCCLIEKRFRAFLVLLPFLTAVLAVCSLALAAAAIHAGGSRFASEVWDMQVGSRLVGVQASDFYYYLIHGFTTYAISYPLALLVLIRLRKPLFRLVVRSQASAVGRQPLTSVSCDPALRLLGLVGASFLVLFIVLQIPSAKMARYLLPLAPMASLVAASLMVETSSTSSQKLASARVWLMKTLGLLPVLGLGAAGLLLVIWSYLPLDAKPRWWLLFISLFAVAGMRFKLVPRIGSSEGRHYLIGVLGFAVFAVIHLAVAEPVRESLEKARPFVAKLETMRRDGEPLVFYRIGPDQEDIRYILNASRPTKPLFLKTPGELSRVPGETWVIARESGFATLPGEIRKGATLQFRGRLGHRRCVVFRLGRK